MGAIQSFEHKGLCQMHKTTKQQDTMASYIAKGGIHKWCIKTRKSRKLKNISSQKKKEQEYVKITCA